MGMSLCVAWKYEDERSCGIYFASDSCVVVGNNVMPYGGIKSLEIPVRIISATDATTGGAEELFQGNYVDIMVGVEALADVQTKPFNLQEHGYEYLGDRLIPGQRSYRKRGDRAFNVHVAERNGEFWRKAIQLRDYLRHHPQGCDQFAREKLRIFNVGSWTLVRYLDARANYFTQLMERAANHQQAGMT
jgi:hypothetical protein